MAVTVLNSTDLSAIVKDATGEGLPAKEEAKPAEETKEEQKETAAETPDDDKEDEDGLTPREKRELTAKMQKAVGKRVRQAREAEEFAAEEYRQRRLAEQRAEQLQAELAKLQKAPEPEKPARPERGQFATDAEYIEAVTNFAVAEALAKKEADDRAAAEKARQAEIMESAKAKVAKAIELVPDFEEVTASADIEIPPHVAGYMQESEMFAELGFFLAKNQDVVKALHKMTPARQLVEIGKIEGKLSPFAVKADTNGAKPSEKEGTNGSQAPKPAPREATGEAPSVARRAAPVITPISTNGAGSVEPDLETMNVRDHIAEFAKRKGANLLRRQRH